MAKRRTQDSGDRRSGSTQKRPQAEPPAPSAYLPEVSVKRLQDERGRAALQRPRRVGGLREPGRHQPGVVADPLQPQEDAQHVHKAPALQSFLRPVRGERHKRCRGCEHVPAGLHRHAVGALPPDLARTATTSGPASVWGALSDSLTTPVTQDGQPESQGARQTGTALLASRDGDDAILHGSRDERRQAVAG